MRRGMRERAGAVEDAMVEVVGMCRGCVGEVFKSDVRDVGERGEMVGEVEGERRPKGGEEVLWDTLEGDKRREVPLVKGFDRLSLLGR